MNADENTTAAPTPPTASTGTGPEASVPQSMANRGENRSRRPGSQAFREFMGSHWAPRPDAAPERSAVADRLPARARAAGEPFPGERLVVPAGTLKTRNNDNDYRFRAHSAFAHLSGLGGEKEPDAVLVLEPRSDGTHEAVLYFRPRASRASEEFYADSTYGEFWVGARPSLAEVQAQTGLRCAHIDTLRDALAKDAGQVRLRIVPGVDAKVEAMVNEVRQQAGLPFGGDARGSDEKLEERLSEIRLRKDDFELSELRHAVEVTKAGFEDIIRSLPRAIGHHRGERVIEGAFGAVAREEGNGLGYDTIAAAGNHANTLHWMDNDGEVRPGDLVLVDAGVEVDSLYTADITRTLPVSGRYSPAQARVYQAVLDAAEAALARANEPGVRFRDVHDAAMAVIADRLEQWGVLPVSAAESLSAEGQQHRRWMPHGTSHHLGLDVHDCAQARREMYQDALLESGMTFTIEPGLYFRADDMSVPEELRGIGVRIEDDVQVNPDGTVTRISEGIPRTIADVEAWIADVQSR
jgi:Xaa-Pro aminopeptidase